MSYLKGLGVDQVDVEGEVLEALVEGSPGPLDGDDAALDGDLNPLGDLHQLVRVDHLHLEGCKRVK